MPPGALPAVSQGDGMLPKPRSRGPGTGRLGHVESGPAPSPPRGPSPTRGGPLPSPVGVRCEPRALVTPRGSAGPRPSPPASSEAPRPTGSAPSPSAFPQGTPPRQLCLNAAHPYLFCRPPPSLDLPRFLPPSPPSPPREGTAVRYSPAGAQRHGEFSKGRGGWRC